MRANFFALESCVEYSKHTQMEQGNQNNRLRPFVPPLPARKPTIPSIGRSIVNNRNNFMPRIRALPQLPRLNNNNNLRLIQMPQQTINPIIINPSRSVVSVPTVSPIANKKPQKKREKKSAEEHGLLFLKWVKELTNEEGIDCTCFYFNKNKGGVFCTICEASYKTGLNWFILSFFLSFFFALYFLNQSIFFFTFFLPKHMCCHPLIKHTKLHIYFKKTKKKGNLCLSQQ